MAGTVATADVAVPRSVTVTPRSATEALVTWDPVDGSASTYLDLLTGAGALVGETVEIPPGTRSYALNGLRPLRDYAVRLRACSSAGCSPHTAPHLVSMPSSLTAAELDGIIPLDPTTESIVEGLERPTIFGDSTGAIRGDYREPDRVRIEVEPADVQRFLVVNELYHPNWRAYAMGPGGGTELKVWPTNVVMRGVLIPPGVTEIEMRFEPFLVSWTATSFVIAGLVISLAAWLALRSLDVAQPARSSGR